MAGTKGKSGGPRSGGGRPKGAKGKATIEREINAAQVIDKARKEGRDLAVMLIRSMALLGPVWRRSDLWSRSKRQLQGRAPSAAPQP